MTLLVLKALHLFAAFAWMAGLWYYPRLLIYQREIYDKEGSKSLKLDILRTMSGRLMYYILMPAMAVTLVMGLLLAVLGGYFQFAWMHGKLLCVLVLLFTSMYFARIGRKMREGNFVVSARTLRLLNEVPTVILVAILFLVVVYPFM